MKRAIRHFDSPVVAAHFGGVDSYEQVLSVLSGENLYFDTSMGYGMMPKYYALKIIEKHGVDRILFGTDSPWHNAEMERALLSSLSLTDEELEKIYSGNAKRLLRL